MLTHTPTFKLEIQCQLILCFARCSQSLSHWLDRNPCYHKSRKMAHVPFTTGFSQGDAPGPGFSFLALHFGIHVTLQQFPALDVKAYAIMDGVTFLGTARHLGPIYARLQLILKDCLHLNINLTKSSLVALQLNTIVSPDCDLTHIYQECPDLRSLLMKTEGFVCVGVPIGHLNYLDTYMQQLIGELSMEFQKLISYMILCSCSVIAAIKKSSIWNEPLGLISSFTPSSLIISLTPPMLSILISTLLPMSTLLLYDQTNMHLAMII